MLLLDLDMKSSRKEISSKNTINQITVNLLMQHGLFSESDIKDVLDRPPPSAICQFVGKLFMPKNWASAWGLGMAPAPDLCSFDA